MPIRSLSDSHQLPFRLLNVISVIKQTRVLHGVLWCAGNVTFLPIRLLSDSHHISSDFNESPIQIPKFNDRCLSDSHQIPIRLPSSSFQIPQRNLIQFGANQLPISLPSDSHQKNIQIHQCNFDSKPPHLQGCSAKFIFSC